MKIQYNKKKRILIYCKCGCGNQLISVNVYGRDRKYILGHNSRGHKCSDIAKEKIRLANIGKKYSNDLKKKISLAHMGQERTLETRKKISLGLSPRKEFNGFIQNKIRVRVENWERYRKFKKKILGRDNYTCILCSYKGRDVEIHHRIKFSDIIKIENINDVFLIKEDSLLFNGDVVGTYCKKCHTIVDRDRGHFFGIKSKT